MGDFLGVEGLQCGFCSRLHRVDSTQLQDGSGKARRMVHTLEPSTRETEAGKQAGLYESGHVERPCIKIK